jgi:acetolactate synthase-1/2/3 large subunit
MTSIKGTVSCGEALIGMLQARGVEVVFGIPGVHTLELYRGLAASSIRHVTPRHEQGAAFMADGYARVGRRPGVCVLITGPGVTNAGTAVASAYHDSQPLLVISSATATRDAGRGHGALHDLPDQQAFMSTITAFSENVQTPEQLPDALVRAFAVLHGPRPRPVHIGIPIDVLARPFTTMARAVAQSDGATCPAPDAPSLDRAVQLLAEAKQPIILLGGGGIDAGAAALRISAATGSPIATTLNGKGAVPESHPASLGATLTLQPVYGALEQADVVLAVGTEFSEVDYYYQGELPMFHGVLIRVDIDAAQLNSKRVSALNLWGEAGETLTRLAQRLESRSTDNRALQAAARTADLRSRLEWWPGAEDFFGPLDAIAAALPERSIVVADSTLLAYVANSYLQVNRPRAYLAPAGYGTLGPALPMAVGAQIAAPDRPVMCLVGDGGLLFTVAELATAAQLGLPLAIVLWHNHGYGKIRDSMDRAAVPHLGTDASAHDFMGIAAGFGCRGVRLTALEQVGEALRGAFGADRPTLIEVPAEVVS